MCVGFPGGGLYLQQGLKDRGGICRASVGCESIYTSELAPTDLAGGVHRAPALNRLSWTQCKSYIIM